MLRILLNRWPAYCRSNHRYLQCICVNVGAEAIMFYKGSRYETVGDAHCTDKNGRDILYKKMRIIPDTPAQFRHLVMQGDRPDLLAFRYYRDPLKFWHIADANGCMNAEELTAQPGKRILIPPDVK